MEYKDYYRILGVDKGADLKAINAAYKKLAVKFHPDKNPGDKKAEERFKEINEAKAVLADPEKRKLYDAYGENWQYAQQGGAPGSQRSGAGARGGFDFSNFAQGEGGPGFSFGFGEGGEGYGEYSEFFQSFFGGGGRGSRRAGAARGVPGQDFRAEMELSLEEAYQGAERMVDLGGQRLKLNLKPGLSDGQNIRLAGKGGPGIQGGPNGDVLITVRMPPHPDYERKGDDLYKDVAVDIYTAVLGGKVKVRTLKGEVNLAIPAGTDGGKMLRLRGLGMPVYGKANQFGDFFARIAIKTPKHLSEKEKSLFRELAEIREGQFAESGGG